MDSRISVLFLIILLTLPGRAGAQTADRLDALLETRELSYALACSMVLPAAGLAGADTTPEAAFAEALARNFLPPDAEPEGAILLGELSFLIMRAFGMKSGFMYALFPGPRYAYRELVYRDILQGRNDPALTVSGARLLRILGRVLDYRGDAR
jgi:hypothetical protein